ncbi:formylglycine-generating enzyme family protein [Psychrobacter sp. AOP22-C1-22]|uniref:formylglycine-generating enzyme family protein n=1 Tax=unclassified Psychrobacter TaxID=196806 RepID=UPI00178805EB|nr:SUMF1/EgtB/PvdO family nonheme iron enzyme [Psychrobacter sp. FME6]MBE0407713.1 SUMF1/EgtB/PvdO family nonheme iron enzyme [Psychrobacter sp. FME6]
MTLKPLFVSLFIMPLFAMTACAKEPATSADSNGVPQTRSNLSADEQQQLNDFLAQQKENMRFIEGGSYEMGDFGHKLDWTGGLPISSEYDSKPLHPVTLDSFSMNAYKATYDDFDTYSMATGKPREGMQDYAVELHQPTAAAGVNWQTAQHYCQWLGQQLDVPMSLPTEAQWEYAARNRGEYVLFPTDNGKVDAGRNIATFEQQKELRQKYNTGFMDVPLVGMFPPNPLGLYDLINQNYEWTMDWYAADYYERSPELNPKGPEIGTEKVVRSLSTGEGGADNIRLGIGPVTVLRSNRLPDPPLIDNDPRMNQNRNTSSRCVANSLKPLS